MPNVLLSHSYFYKFDPKQWANKTPFPPLGTIYLASQLRSVGYVVDFYDTNLLDDLTGFEQYLKNSNPKYFILYDDGFNYLTKMCLTNMREAAFRMIEKAKLENCVVLVCSSDSSDHYEKYLEAGADYIVYGEGELTTSEVLQKLDKIPQNDLTTVPGIIYKESSKIQKNAPRQVLKDLDKLHQPAWDLVDIEAYKAVWGQSKKDFTLNIATTRGCPFKCNWCAKPIYGNRYNSHSPEYILEQVKYHKEHHAVTNFWMCDDIFGLKPNWVQQFNKLLDENDLKISYYMQSRVDLLLKDDNLDALAESGLTEVWVGAESGSQKILDAMDKGTKIEQIHQATQLLKSKNIRVAFFLQFGYPGEQWKDVKKTIDLVMELMPDDIGISVSYPLPGTGFYDQVKSQLKSKTNWTDSDDLDLMFENTFKPQFYKILHRYVHNRYRIKKGWQLLTKGTNSPGSSLTRIGLDLARMLYHLPLAIFNRYRLLKYSKL